MFRQFCPGLLSLRQHAQTQNTAYKRVAQDERQINHPMNDFQTLSLLSAVFKRFFIGFIVLWTRLFTTGYAFQMRQVQPYKGGFICSIHV